MSKGKVSAIHRITKGAMLLKCQGKNTRTPTHIHTQKMNMTHPKRCFRGVVVRVLYQRRLARFCHASCRATERKCFFLSVFLLIFEWIYGHCKHDLCLDVAAVGGDDVRMIADKSFFVFGGKISF